MGARRVPAVASIKRRLASERRKLAGLCGHDAPGATVASARPVSALIHLQGVLTSLPKEIRYRIEQLRIDPGEIRIDGQARSHAEADQLAVALRKSGRYQADLRKTELLKDRGVSFLLTVRPTGDPSKSDGGTR